MKTKCRITPANGVGRPMNAHLCIYKSHIRGKLSMFSQLSFSPKQFLDANSFIHMFCIVNAKYKVAPSKAVVGVDWPINGTIYAYKKAIV